MRSAALDLVNGAIVEATIHLRSVSVFGLHKAIKSLAAEEQPIVTDADSAAPAAVSRNTKIERYFHATAKVTDVMGTR